MKLFPPTIIDVAHNDPQMKAMRNQAKRVKEANRLKPRQTNEAFYVVFGGSIALILLLLVILT